MRVRFPQSSRDEQNGTHHSHFAHARYDFRMIDRILNWGESENKIKSEILQIPAANLKTK